MKKRFLSAGLAVVMSASLTACGGSAKETTAAAAADTTAAAKEESGFGRKVSEATESSPEKRQHAPVEKFFHYSGSFGPGTVYRWKCDAEEGNRTDTVWLHERGKGTGR